MFRRTRERFEAIERALSELLKRSESPAAAPAAAPSTDAVANLLGKMMESNVDLVGAMGDLAVRSVARRNGIRGGTQNARTAQRDRDGKFLPKENRARRRSAARTGPLCELCEFGENYPGVTVDMIKAHRAHNRTRGADYGSQPSDAPNDDDPIDPVDPAAHNGAGPVH
jgi:hypothetical protein